MFPRAFGDSDPMPISVTLVFAGKTVVLADPSGGTFDAAGDFDRLLPMENQLPVQGAPDLPTLGRIDAYADVEFSPDDMAAIRDEAVALLQLAKPGPEARGLKRLRVLAEHGAQMPGAVLRVEAD